jgi:hypothetical protein
MKLQIYYTSSIIKQFSFFFGPGGFEPGPPPPCMYTTECINLVDYDRSRCAHKRLQYFIAHTKIIRLHLYVFVTFTFWKMCVKGLNIDNL